MKRPLLAAVLALTLLMTSDSLSAQTDSAQKQFWPEIDFYYRINNRIRFYTQLSGTTANSTYTDGTLGVYLDYFAKPWLKGRRNDTDMADSANSYYWWFRTGYSYSDAPPGDKQKKVNIFETETNNTFHLPADIVLQSRNRFDWRWVNGDFQPIYRPRLKFIRNFKTSYLTFNAYIWSEYFFYLNDHSQDRLRLTFGSKLKVSDKVSIELYYLHQFQHQQTVEPINAIGFIVDLYFHSKQLK